MTTDAPDAEYDLPPLEFADEIETDTAQVLSNVGTLIQDIIWQRKKPRLSIPVQYTDDDLVIGGAISQAEKDLKEAARLIRTLTAERDKYKWHAEKFSARHMEALTKENERLNKLLLAATEEGA